MCPNSSYSFMNWWYWLFNSGSRSSLLSIAESLCSAERRKVPSWLGSSLSGSLTTNRPSCCWVVLLVKCCSWVAKLQRDDWLTLSFDVGDYWDVVVLVDWVAWSSSSALHLASRNWMTVAVVEMSCCVAVWSSHSLWFSESSTVFRLSCVNLLQWNAECV